MPHFPRDWDAPERRAKLREWLATLKGPQRKPPAFLNREAFNCSDEEWDQKTRGLPICDNKGNVLGWRK